MHSLVLRGIAQFQSGSQGIGQVAFGDATLGTGQDAVQAQAIEAVFEDGPARLPLDGIPAVVQRTGRLAVDRGRAPPPQAVIREAGGIGTADGRQLLSGVPGVGAAAGADEGAGIVVGIAEPLT